MIGIRRQLTLLNVLTPITPGAEGRLALHLEEAKGSIRFGDLSSTHFARWVIIGQVSFDGAAKRRVKSPLRMQYLLFSAACNNSPRQFFEELRLILGPDVDAVWRHCVNYPGHARRAEFHEYLRHNTLPTVQRFAAHDATVAEIRAALTLRQQHIELAGTTQQLPPELLRDEFCKQFLSSP